MTIPSQLEEQRDAIGKENYGQCEPRLIPVRTQGDRQKALKEVSSLLLLQEDRWKGEWRRRKEA